ncbi:MAG: septum formation initiator family protein [Oligoflexia bacterium]|nr:septum formation initiator family protein [Oligoflexia bacterium]
MSLLIKISWGATLLLLLRLIFADRGIMDYLNTEKIISEQKNMLKGILSENESLIMEIEKIKNDRSYQIKLVRDNLGAMDSNEYLILFDLPSSSNVE